MQTLDKMDKGACEGISPMKDSSQMPYMRSDLTVEVKSASLKVIDAGEQKDKLFKRNSDEFGIEFT